MRLQVPSGALSRSFLKLRVYSKQSAKAIALSTVLHCALFDSNPAKSIDVCRHCKYPGRAS